MICLTGDVHHMSMQSFDQAFLPGTEVDAALKYAQIASQFKLKVTLFITGKCVEEEHAKLAILSRYKNVEFGGHNYNAFRPLLPYRLSHLILNRKNGPAFIQKRDIQKTSKIIKEKLGVKIDSWRDHAFRNDANTKKLLFSYGIKYFSDFRSPSTVLPFNDKSLCHFPINTLPDHDHIYHGSFQDRSPKDRHRLKNRSPFGMGRMDIKDWLRVVKKQVDNISKQQGVATLLVHPGCMEIGDNFETFMALCSFLSGYESITMNEYQNVR